MYLISRSFQKFAKFKSVCVFVCVCVCVYKCETSKQSYNCHLQNTTSRITLRNATKFQKFRNWKFEKFITYTRRKTLPAWNVVTFPRRLKYCIQQNSHENVFSYALSFNSFMPGGDIWSYKLNKPAAKSWSLFKCARPFVTTRLYRVK